MTDHDRSLLTGYLAGTLTPKESEALNQLLRSDPEARAALLQQAHLDQLLHDVSGEPEVSVIPFNTSPPKENPRRQKTLPLALGAAAALTIAGISFVALRPDSAPPKELAVRDEQLEKPKPNPTPEETYSRAIAKLQDSGSQKRSVSQAPTLVSAPGKKISYNQHIRPILSENCFHCHGPDQAKREADIALHEPEVAYAAIKGIAPIVPGKPDESEVVHRIFDEDDPMPPSDSNRSLTDEEKELLKRWIAEGAEYEKHWAFVPPEKPAPPTVEDHSVPVHNPIDHFIQSKLAEKGLSPSPEAKPEVLARRASLALTGLQPDLDLLDQYLSNPTSQAYEQYVDQLLESDAYAERMALFWLDAGRYADTDGYQNDSPRSNWPWRDWVIKAYRDNMPFDRFTIEQLAGDMLPDATETQQLASAFNRNHRQNNEGGALAEEFLVENVIDRVETTSTIWLGLTTGCARCHDHKYDPISQREFFQLYAYFNNINERGIGRGIEAQPVKRFTSPLNKIPADLQRKKDLAEQAITDARKTAPERLQEWLENHHQLASEDSNRWNQAFLQSASTTEGQGALTALPDHTYLFEGNNISQTSYYLQLKLEKGERLTGLRLDALGHDSFKGLSRSNNGNFVLTGVNLSHTPTQTEQALSVKIAKAVASFEQKNYPAQNALDNKDNTGWAVSGNPDSEASLVLVLEKALEAQVAGELEIHLQFNSPFADHNIGRLRVQTSSSKDLLNGLGLQTNKPVYAAIRKKEADRSAAEKKLLQDHFKTIDPVMKKAEENLAKVEGEFASKGLGAVPVMVMNESSGEPAPAYLLNRGQYNEPDKSEALPRRMLEALLPGDDQPADRLELARWLVSRENPITARVVVNRMWQRMMGVGLVKTSEDFGSQGELPVNPELLDWLALEFIDSGWDVKGLYRTIVTSHTFRQSSRSNPRLNEIDPENRYLARGPRYRLDGFAIRDIALNASGLLHPKLGGAPVKPYQPAGLWASVAANKGTNYIESKGQDLFRKSMYTYWKRAVNPPRQTIFDASGREVCNVRHKITNTPLQALALMNDETFLEAARNLAARGLREAGAQPQERLAYLYRLATGYTPDSEMMAIFESNHSHFAEHFAQHPEEADDFLNVGASPRDPQLDPIEHAAYTATAHLILNLDETITLE
ncbi:PSD1 and planctomycete cytochrome C domain-containing protein [Roseibacillus persicicus]|uniref:Cytochrome c n=1 Tax=Roseibacillus persicicus TaxID=454148 RepID=A0A918TBE9_9BACT|nr:PSD1 and planctomycete cytochrome C domain-containing protein [Roseibacillus persicicus]GHC40281.1 cytochrome c [Roseibacillus persicicus]